jgi:hypothetical protein
LRRLTFEIVLSDLCFARVNLQAGLVHGVATEAREQHVILRGADLRRERQAGAGA